jgi:hypothetical protein
MSQTIQKPYQFAFHDRVSNTPPQFNMWDKVTEKGVKGLTREEKNNFFHSMQNNSGKHYYMLGGWTFPFKQFMKRFAVKYNYDSGFSEIWAFDKTCIRSSFYTNSGVVEIIEL